jgi:hypothetical protein
MSNRSQMVVWLYEVSGCEADDLAPLTDEQLTAKFLEELAKTDKTLAEMRS